LGGITLNKNLRIGLDIGSTTVKMVVLGSQGEMLYSKYKRHFSDIKGTVLTMVGNGHEHFKDADVTVMATGSGGLSISKWLEVGFIQEVVACAKTVQHLIPKTDVAIELGGEDAKITYFESGSIDQRMNGTCAGGTGAFIDQMASLLQTDATGLNELAKKYKVIHPIAARCGVFAKTDVQPLINEGAAREDIAASIFQAVVNQTISGLACGKPIRGHVAFLGGPLYFLSELRARFIDTLKLTREQTIVPDHSQLFVATGAAMESVNESAIRFEELYRRVKGMKYSSSNEVPRLDRLFKDEAELEAFKERHNKNVIQTGDLATYRGNCFLGIDAGSTTTKVALISEDGDLLYSYYGSNQGNPLELSKEIVSLIYSQLPKEAIIKNSCVTGYGEALIKEALKLDIGEIETIAHYKAAEFFLPGVEFILDIGGQDMKCLRVKNGIIDDILLNEACSSGCGSFLETFAESLELKIQDFASEALISSAPVDLGSRCTVFMNSRVKQAQKEGATVGDISAGLSYSVIKNALQKVIKIRDPKQMGDKIIVQGGTFYNDSVLRAFEKVSGKEVIRPNISGIMGAFGASLIAKERYQEGSESTMLPATDLSTFKAKNKMSRCELCNNRCMLTINEFSDGRHFISGNRCERGAGLEVTNADVPDLYHYKYKRLFAYKSLKETEATRGTVGLPRVLNMYENYPYWHTFFTELGYRVVLSPRSNKEVYEAGIETIPSESACYPAKIVHGHIIKLIEKKVDFIFYTSVPHEVKEVKGADNNFNCPIVTSYPETIKHNMDAIVNEEIEFMSPFLPMDTEERLAERLYEEFSIKGLSKDEVYSAATKAWAEKAKARLDIQLEGERVIKWLESNNKIGIVLGGRPYHVDPEINHGLTNIITNLGMAVLTEDSINHLSDVDRPLRVLDQWAYHSRLYAAAEVVGKNDRLEMVQLTSFGCGVDAVTADQVQEILAKYGKIYTLIKIDEGNNLGAIRIRMRSLKAAIEEREKQHKSIPKVATQVERVPFTKAHKAKHTFIGPKMSPMHFDLYETGFKAMGYNVVILPIVDHKAIDTGLTYVNNDACYPSILVVGQIMEALKSGDYDLDNVSIFISQTGGGCRASNYIGFIRKALIDSNMSHIPVVSINASGLEGNPGFKIGLPLVHKAMMATVYGDLFMRVLYATRPYELVEGAANELYEYWRQKAKETIISGNFIKYRKELKAIVEAFDQLPRKDIIKPKVGIVGEILIKYHPTGNNQLASVLEKEGVQVVLPDLMDFFLYSAYNQKFKYEKLNGSKKAWQIARLAIWIIDLYRGTARKNLDVSKHFHGPSSIVEKAILAERLISLGNQTGEGWFLTGEMVELVKDGVENIVCVQPFGCLPNHVVGKSMIKPIKKMYPMANIAAIDYDPGASEVNQLNRVKLMLSVAFSNLEKKTTQLTETKVNETSNEKYA
jgi:predicted CoA-substrate-specific enzyme activase